MIRVCHSGGEYEVKLVDRENLLRDLPEGAVVITDEHVAPLMPEASAPIVLPAGEKTKSIGAYAEALSALAQRGCTRKSTLVALGGGVIGDLAGFVAATYMRGIRLIQIPTTLLAQVDSSVGGKVGIDLREGKNLAGAFYPPHEVRLCPAILASLPPRQFVNGMAEVWKYGFIMDSALVEELEAHPAVPGSTLDDIVFRCIRLKAQVVQEDEFETTGRRAILNFGHTVAHAIEHHTGYGPVLHGEAVAIGMVVEASLGEQLGVTPAGTHARVTAAMRQQGLPTRHEVLEDIDGMLEAMRRDKKATRDGLALALLTQIGACELVPNVPPSAIAEALRKA